MTKRVKLDISTISDELYDALLQEFKERFGSNASFDEWEVSATITTEDDDATLRCPECGYTMFGTPLVVEVPCSNCQ